MDPLNRILTSQFHAALLMLRECIEKCPEDHWDSLIARYTFWQVAYHTLCMVDCRLDLSDEAWQPHPLFHPAGRADLEDEYPSRRFTRPELLAYLTFCQTKLTATIPAETAAALNAPAPGFPFSRAELHLQSIRHIQHHTGQLSASLRRVGVETRWVKAGP